MTTALTPTRPESEHRTLHVERCMGTVFTIDIRGDNPSAAADNGGWDAAVRDAVAWLHHVDTVFSTYRPGSDLRRIQRRELRAAEADADILPVLELCARVQADTDGYFTAMPDGRLDPTGLVKGWAVERASQLLRRHGSANHAVNGGGDVQLAGQPVPGVVWTVGIADPHDRSRVLGVVGGRDARDLAVATSGTSERGAHIVNPFTGQPALAVAGATVAGASLTLADAYATATCAMGHDALRWIERIDGYELLLVDTDGKMRVSSGWHRRFGVEQA